MAKSKTVIGIDQDVGYLRAVRLGVEHPKAGPSKSLAYRLLDAFELDGNFADDESLFKALKQLDGKMSVSSMETVVTCLSGKQTYAGQMDVKKLPDDEMGSMLKLELRKLMPFEPTAAAFDYHWLPVPPAPVETGGLKKGPANVPVIVCAATNSALTRHLRIYDKAGIKPSVIDVLPLAAANAFWALREEDEESDHTYVILFMGSETCTLIIDGNKSPFFNRSFAFDINGVASQPTGSSDSTLQMDALAEEVNKSINYYRNTYKCRGVSSITLMGAHASHPAFEVLSRKTGYTAEPVQTAQQLSGGAAPEPGKFDLAVGLAMQGVS
jgi:Tfp pilus assembly PilM family ATPase